MFNIYFCKIMAENNIKTASEIIKKVLISRQTPLKHLNLNSIFIYSCLRKSLF